MSVKFGLLHRIVLVLRMQIQYQRRLELHHIQEQKRESEPLHHLPMTELPSPANLLNRSARKSLSIKIDDVDSESSMGRRSSKSISSVRSLEFKRRSYFSACRLWKALPSLWN